MPYQVLARKWRPQTFAEVVGQEHISRTLKNAISQGRIGHAYLFVGSRGIGKTTSARIFAKALNCLDNRDGEPCCQCECCQQAAKGAALDIIEIDGASHNRVEHIRDIRENVQYTPAKGKYKIYIIDEVHMLTPQAWNALLKTLEEPPAHVKFLFATTEPHKVLPTIISRCQRFDLKRIPVPLIVQRLRQIADGEKIAVADEALLAIARAADGGMRDAQSIFDQMIAFCGGLAPGELIREQDVIDVFGLASGMELREIAAGIFTNDLNRSMLVLHSLADAGRDLERVFADLIGYVRNVMVVATCRDARTFLEVSETELEDLLNIGRVVDPLLVQRILQGLVSQEWSFRSALNKRIQFETVLARLMLEAHSVQIDDIFTQLNRLSGSLPQEAMPPPRTTPAIPAAMMPQEQRKEAAPPADAPSAPAVAPSAPPAMGAQQEPRTENALASVTAPAETPTLAVETPAPAAPMETPAPAAPVETPAPTSEPPVSSSVEMPAPAILPEPDAVESPTSSQVALPDESTTKEATPTISEVRLDESPSAAPVVEQVPSSDVKVETAAPLEHFEQVDSLPPEVLDASDMSEAQEEPDGLAVDPALTTANLFDHLARAADSQDDEVELDGAEGGELNELIETAAKSLKSDDVVRRLTQTLMAAGETDLAAVVKKMNLLAFPQDTMLLTLGYDLDTMPVNDLLLIQDGQTRVKLKQALQKLWPQASMQLQANETPETEHARISYRAASPEEQAQLEANPFVQKVTQLFGAVVVETRIKNS